MAKEPLPHVGLIGIDDLGAALLKRLHTARYALSIFDGSSRRMQAFEDDTTLTRRTPRLIATAADIILINLQDWRETSKLAENDMAEAIPGKVIIDLGFMPLSETRRIADLMKHRGIEWIDAPVSGSATDAKKAALTLFAGCNRKTYDKLLPLFRLFTSSGQANYCGLSGSGQIVKSIEQLAVSASRAAFLEALAFGRCQGFTIQSLQELLRNSVAMSVNLNTVMESAIHAGAETISVHPPRLTHIMDAASRQNQALPMTEGLMKALAKAEPTVIENGTHVPSYWNMLTGK